MRGTLWLLLCALLACGSEPSPDPKEALAKLQEIEQRLVELEAQYEEMPTAPPTTQTDDAPPKLGQMAVDVIEGPLDSGDRVLQIEITKTGYVVDGRTLDRDAVAAHIEATVKEHADASLMVRAAQGVDHAKVVALLDIAKARGVKRLAIASPSVSSVD